MNAPDSFMSARKQAEALRAEQEEWARDAATIAEWEAFDLQRLMAEQDAENLGAQ